MLVCRICHRAGNEHSERPELHQMHIMPCCSLVADWRLVHATHLEGQTACPCCGTEPLESQGLHPSLLQEAIVEKTSAQKALIINTMIQALSKGKITKNFLDRAALSFMKYDTHYLLELAKEPVEFLAHVLHHDGLVDFPHPQPEFRPSYLLATEKLWDAFKTDVRLPTATAMPISRTNVSSFEEQLKTFDERREALNPLMRRVYQHAFQKLPRLLRQKIETLNHEQQQELLSLIEYCAQNNDNGMRSEGWFGTLFQNIFQARYVLGLSKEVLMEQKAMLMPEESFLPSITAALQVFEHYKNLQNLSLKHHENKLSLWKASSANLSPSSSEHVGRFVRTLRETLQKETGGVSWKKSLQENINAALYEQNSPQEFKALL